jgi:predicted TIM-barrel fold metal-dependent hydrolase
MLIADAQIHIWKSSKPNPNHRQIADYSANDALKEMDEAGVTAAVIHPPGWDPNANALAVEAAREHPSRFAILGNFPIDRPESRSLIDRWKSRPGMLGLRFALLQPHQKTWLSDGRWTGSGRRPSALGCRSRCSGRICCGPSVQSPSAIAD